MFPLAVVVVAVLALIAVAAAVATADPAAPVMPVTTAPMIVIVPLDALALVQSHEALDTAGVAPRPVTVPSPSCGSEAALTGVLI